MSVSLSIELTESNVNVASNTSVVTANVYITSDARTWNHYNPPGSITIDGTTTTFTASFSRGGRQWLARASKTVTHNADGTKSINASASYDTGGYYGTIKASASKTLTRIPRKAIAISNSAWSATLGQSSVTVTIEKKTSAFTYKKYVEVNGRVWTYGDFSQSAGRESWTFAYPLNLANLSPTNGVFTCRQGVITYAGNEEIGRDYYTITCTIPSDIRPTIQELSLTGFNRLGEAYLQGRSSVRFNWVLGKVELYGATVERISFTMDGKTSTTTGGAHLPPSNYEGTFTRSLPYAGARKWSITVTDSRGRTHTRSDTLQVEPYQAPSITSLSVTRAGADGTADPRGTVCRVDYKATKASVAGKNDATITVYINGTKKESKQVAGASTSSSGYFLIPGLATDRASTVKLVIEDRAGQRAEQSQTVSKALVLFDVSPGGIGIGATAEDGYITLGTDNLELRGINEQGTESTGTWIRFADGTQICYGAATMDVSISNSYGSLYTGNLTWWYPKWFKVGTKPTVTIGQTTWETGASWGSVFSVGHDKCTIRLVDAYKRDKGTVTYSAIAIGRWK